MVEKIKKLAKSPVIASDNDIDNFVRIMELSAEYRDILHKSKTVMKNYYISGLANIEDEIIIDNALILISGELPNSGARFNNADKDTEQIV